MQDEKVSANAILHAMVCSWPTMLAYCMQPGPSAVEHKPGISLFAGVFVDMNYHGPLKKGADGLNPSTWMVQI